MRRVDLDTMLSNAPSLLESCVALPRTLAPVCLPSVNSNPILEASAKLRKSIVARFRVPLLVR